MEKKIGKKLSSPLFTTHTTPQTVRDNVFSDKFFSFKLPKGYGLLKEKITDKEQVSVTQYLLGKRESLNSALFTNYQIDDMLHSLTIDFYEPTDGVAGYDNPEDYASVYNNDQAERVREIIIDGQKAVVYRDWEMSMRTIFLFHKEVGGRNKMISIVATVGTEDLDVILSHEVLKTIVESWKFN